MTKREKKLTAKIEPFDTFWEGPEDVEKGYGTFGQFYKSNYLNRLPKNTSANILVTSSGPGYFVHLLRKEGYTNVLGIDSCPEKTQYAIAKGLPCKVEYAFDFLEKTSEAYDVIFVEQEINHLDKDEVIEFLVLCRRKLKTNGTLIVHSLNGANPITGAEALAQNYDHYSTFTEYSLKQILRYAQFEDIHVFPLKLYVFYTNPLNYLGIIAHKLLDMIFKMCFVFYGKQNRIFTKKIGACCRKSSID